ncbi:DUF4249 domain-containing protein [Flavobacterium yafengii]|jgi:hypothetical protein|uniref:DUF4249 domain-containing protein n=1 Tax=Flavobacterium yafengii TaxID=3041253 RepID=A0AAW6TIT5_9FLAO|nr:DUF4249 domain-containing protein [Flavobacterium yafengii]MDI5949525.1 DUF4249 domain-containing protein [Flavobacterium yafengii]MDI6045845.1 DUF4249 domain-containing protein [Flavobacterium yafengii]
MKKIIVYLIFIIAVFSASCEDVVEVDLDNAPPKLVIEAAINWKKGTSGSQQKIKLTTTTGFYSTEIPKVSGATISIKNSSNIVFNFSEIANTGEYTCATFIPVLNETYTLTVISNGNTYTATETLKPVTPITKIVQNNEGGFTGKNIEIKTFYKDPANETNYYLYKYVYSNQVKSNYYVDQDEFFNGNEFFSISQNDDLKKDDKIEVSHFGISKAYYNYMSVLVSIAGNNGGGPFQSPPATVRGNIINTTDEANYPLGYFSLSEVDIRNYTIE